MIRSLSVASLAIVRDNSEYLLVKNRGETRKKGFPMHGPLGGAVSVGLERMQGFRDLMSDFSPCLERPSTDERTIDMRLTFEAPPSTEKENDHLTYLIKQIFDSLTPEELSPVREMCEELTGEETAVILPDQLVIDGLTRAHVVIHANTSSGREGRLHLYQFYTVQLGGDTMRLLRERSGDSVIFVRAEDISTAVDEGRMLDTTRMMLTAGV